MICMLKLGERDCLLRGAPGERSSWASSGLMRCSSFRLMVEWRWEPLPESTPTLSGPAPAVLSRLPSLPFRFKFMQSKDLLDEALPVLTRVGPAGKLRCFFIGLSWIASNWMLAGGDCCRWRCLLTAAWWSLGRSAALSRSASLSFSRDSRALMAFLMLLLLLLFRLPPRCPTPPLVLVPLGWLLFDAPEEKPSSGSLTLKDSSPPLMPSASEQEHTHQVNRGCWFKEEQLKWMTLLGKNRKQTAVTCEQTWDEFS